MSSQETDSVYIIKCSDHTNSEHGSDSKVVQEDNLVKLTSDEVDILWKHLEEWKTLKGDNRNMIKQQDWSIKGQVPIKKGLAEVGSKVDCMEGHQATEEGSRSCYEILIKEELDEASHVAEEWNNTQLSPEVQAQAAERKGCQYARAFAENMWKQFVTRVVVMVTWKDTKGKLMAGMYDFNDELGDGMAFPEWESIQDKWSTYATDVFDTKEMVDVRRLMREWAETGGSGRGRRGHQYHFQPWKMASGKVSASVPWMSIGEDLKGYIESKYFPVDVSFKEPTKLTHAQITKILEFWCKRQWSKPQDIFRFRWWKDPKETLQMPVLENKSQSEKILGKRWQKENSMVEMDSPVQSDTKEPVLLVRKKCWTAENGQDKLEPKNPIRLGPQKPQPHAKLTGQTTTSEDSIPKNNCPVQIPPSVVVLYLADNQKGYNDSKRQPVAEPTPANPVWQSTWEKWAPPHADDDFAAPLTKQQYK
ncbi:hypothetical protein J3A83DRAFT_4186183 [Scleroderma citrinum]